VPKTYDAVTTGTTPPDLGNEALCAAFGLPADGLAVRGARQHVRKQFEDWGLAPDDCDTAALVISELVTNALIHTASEVITCDLETVPGQILIRVMDEGGSKSAPSSQPAAPNDKGGRGLMLVESLSERWGVCQSVGGGGRVVWAALCPTRA
jgi:anti-sigma regulatory factor (Ser/Thr protein kinase)